MKVSSVKGRNMAREHLNGKMEATTREILLMESMKEKDFIILLTKGGNMKVNFSTTKCMVMEKKPGLTVESIKVTTEIQRRTVLEHLFGLMGTCIKVTGEETNRTGREFI